MSVNKLTQETGGAWVRERGRERESDNTSLLLDLYNVPYFECIISCRVLNCFDSTFCFKLKQDLFGLLIMMQKLQL